MERKPGRREPVHLHSNSAYEKLIEKSKSSVDGDSIWLITLSDVMSLLLVFFIMFFVMSRQNEKDTKPQGNTVLNGFSVDPGIKPSPSSSPTKIKHEMESLIKDLAIEDGVSVEAIQRGIIITLKEKVTFRPGDAEILGSSRLVLENIAALITRYPSYRVEIDGHTDTLPINTQRYPSNWELSVARATSVLKYFIDSHGIDPSRLSIRGNADQRPIAPNETPEQRAQNRRVEIRMKESDTSL